MKDFGLDSGKLRISLGITFVISCFFAYFLLEPLNEDDSLLDDTPSVQNSYDEQSRNELMYQIWVPSFRDSDGDGVGDINGITESMSYFENLNVTSILLSPVFPSPAYHGYEVTNYKDIKTGFGSLSDFRALVSKADENNIRVILDIPINHTSDQHPWFLNSLVENSGQQSFYVWTDELPKRFGLPWTDTPNPKLVFHTKKEREGFYYGVFGYPSPDLNYKNPDVVEEILSVFDFWLAYGVSAFRIDAARYLHELGPLDGQRDTPQNMMLLNKFNSHIKSFDKEAILIGEVFASAEIQKQYLPETSKGLDFVFNFEFGPIMWDVATNDSFTSVEKISTIRDSYKYFTKNYNKLGENIVFFENHDVGRLPAKDINKAKLAYSLFFTSPFQLSLYYGGEIGMTQFRDDNDIFYRDSMLWSDQKTNAIREHVSTSLIDDYDLWKTSIKPNVELKAFIAKSSSLRNKTRVFADEMLRVDLSLSADNFLVSAIASDEDLLFAVVNLDTKNNRSFKLNTLPAQTYYNLEDNSSLNISESIEIGAGEFILLGR